MWTFSGTGNLTRDPEIKDLGTTKLAVLSLATNKRIKGVDKPSFIDIKAFGGITQVIEKWHKGDRVQIAGELEMESWTNKDGEKRSRLVVVASHVKGLGNKPQEEGEERTESSNDDEVPF